MAIEISGQEWHSRAACYNSYPGIDFITPDQQDLEAIAKICRGCDVVALCLGSVLALPLTDRVGVYGGRLFSEHASSHQKQEGRPLGECPHSRPMTRHLSCWPCWARRYGFCVDCHEAEAVVRRRCKPCARVWNKQRTRQWRAAAGRVCIGDGCENQITADNATGLCMSCAATKRNLERVGALPPLPPLDGTGDFGQIRPGVEWVRLALKQREARS